MNDRSHATDAIHRPASYESRPARPLTLDRVKELLAPRYRVERELGAGGTAIVYLAHDTEQRMSVAVKVLRPELSAAVVAARFLREFELGQRLRHPNILSVFDSGTSDGELYYTMPYVHGETLRDRIVRETQLSIADTLRIARAIANALDFAHHLDVLHRDIKPANVLLDGQRILVADFGIARAMSEAATTQLTESGIVLGTTAYMSPEQGTGERALTGRADVYALACTVYEMLAGEPPFTGPTPLAVIARHCQEPPRSLQVIRPNVPLGVQRAVEKALAKVPADRFATAGEFVDALEAGARGEWTTNGTPAVAPLGGLRRRAAIAVGVASLALGAAVVGGVAWWRAAHAPLPRPMRFTIEPPAGTTTIAPSGAGHDVALSRDGRSLAFFAGVPSHLYLRQLDRTDAILFPKARGTDLHFSPDGTRLTYMDSGPTVIPFGRDDANAAPIRLAKMAGFGTMWWTYAPDIVYFASDTIWRIAPTDGTPRMIAAMDPKKDLRWRRPVMLPDGKTISFRVMSRAAKSNDDERIALMSIDGGAYDTLSIRARDLVGYFDGVLVFGQSTNQLWRGRLLGVRFDLAKRKVLGDPVVLVDSLDVDPISGSNASISDDGTLAYLVTTRHSTLEMMEPSGRTTFVQRDSGLMTEPVWSPDGTRLAYSTSVDDRIEVFVLDTRTNAVTRISKAGGFAPEWSSDGRRILFAGWASESAVAGPAMWALADGSGDPEPIPGLGPLGTWVSRIRMTPDGKYFVVGVGMRPTNTPKTPSTFAVPVTGGAPILLFSGMSGRPVFVSPGGRYMAYVEADAKRQPQVYVRPFPTGEGRMQVTLERGFNPVWVSDSRLMFTVRGVRTASATLDASGALPRVVRVDSLPYPSSTPSDDLRAVAMRPDGQRIAIIRAADGKSSLVVVVNWRTEVLKKLGLR